MILRADSLSNIGGREENQDYCAFAEISGFGCYLVTDGLGGHGGGALASETVGEGIIDAFTAEPGFSRELLEQYIMKARQAFQVKIAGLEEPKAPKTTLVVMLTGHGRAIWAHIGDSRLYYFAAGRLQFQSSDHSVPQQLANSGEIKTEAIRFHEDRNRLIRAFDGSEGMRIEYRDRPLDLEPGDAFLLCSDGFWEYVLEREMEQDLLHGRNPRAWLLRMEKKLQSRVEKNNDNYTALAVVVYQ